MKTNRRRKGFTLIELIVVIAILAILAAVAVPNFIGLTKRANTATEVAAAAQYASAINIANALAVESDDLITAVPADADGITALNAKLTAAGVGVSTDLSSALLLSNVFPRIGKSGDNFIVTNKADIS